MNWKYIGDLGDPAVMAPICMAIGLWLIASRAWREALLWLSLFSAAAFFVVCTKVAFVGWEIWLPTLDFRGISGHAMAATSILTVSGYFLGGKLSHGGAMALAAIGYGLGVIVGISRIMIGAHSISEVVGGCLLGGIVALALVKPRHGHHPIIIAPAAFSLAFITLIFTQLGERAPSGRWITELALYLSGHSAPFVR